MTPQERRTLIAEILKAAEKPCPDIVESTMQVHKTTGKRHSIFGMPFGYNPADYRTEHIGFVFRSKDGTTYGTVAPTREALIQKHDLWQAHTLTDFNRELEQMSDDCLNSQADYWLKRVAV